MRIKMSQGDIDNNSSILQIKELKEKVRSLVSEVDLHRDNAKFKHENTFDNNLTNSVSSDEEEDDFLDVSEIESKDITNWLTGDDTNTQSVEEIRKIVFSDVDNHRPDITNICRELEASSIREPNIFSSKGPIDSRTFTRPKKFSSRSPLTVVNSSEDERPKLQRRLTTTISPTPNLIPKLEELSKTNNRPVSGNYSELNWQDGAEEGLAEVNNTPLKSKRQSLPASLFDRLQELKKANSTFKMPKVVEPNLSNGKLQSSDRHAFMEDAKKIKAALEINMNDSLTSSRLSDVFKTSQEYYSDDNESFISLGEVSGFCDRLTLSTDQNTYSTIVKEMEQADICLFHRNVTEDSQGNRRLTFGGMEIPIGEYQKIKSAESTKLINDIDELNRTFEIFDDEPEVETNNSFEMKANDKHNIMNTTYDANKKPGLVDVIMQSDVIKSFTPAKKKIQNINNNNNNNNNKVTKTLEGNNILNSTYNKHNGTLDQNELNALRSERYSTKVFDSSFGKSESRSQRSPVRKSNGKKDSDYSEDDCMSTNSDHSYRSVESNSENRTMEELRNVAIQQNKRFASTPKNDQNSKFQFDVMSPIRKDTGDAESHQSFSNPSSRGQSPGRFSGLHQEGQPKSRMPNIRQPLKVPQRELKLKPALARPTQGLKKPSLSYSRTSSEPSVPQKVENSPPPTNVPVLRPSGPAVVPSLTNVRPSSRVSGIPRPPTRLKQPQIRVNLPKK